MKTYYKISTGLTCVTRTIRIYKELGTTDYTNLTSTVLARYFSATGIVLSVSHCSLVPTGFFL